METKRCWAMVVCVVCVFLMNGVFVWGDFYGRELVIGYPGFGTDGVGFHATNDAAGYSDWVWYGPTEGHDHPYHEILSGEWGAAIYYDGIDTALTVDPNDSPTRRQAMWLTQRFSFPDFYTNSDFVYGDTCVGYPDSINPVPNNDKGISVIRNQQVEITIDYEVVDLELINSTADRSPMGYIDEVTGYSKAMPSDRFCFLQTYTIRNIDPNQTLTGLEFYQMLHSHGNNEYAKAVNSTYTNASWDDPLDDYTPYNSVHQTGNFRYDITQWNSMRSPGTEDHVDYISFSSTIEPNWVDTDTFPGGHSDTLIDEYTTGGYMHVKERALNDANSIDMNEVSGSMGWSLGTLDPNEKTFFTIAFMFGEETIPDSAINLTKTINDPNACYSPGDTITYSIEWENVGSVDAENAQLIDYLPRGVLYPVTYSFDPNFNGVSSDPNYNENNRSYELDLGTIPAYSSGFLDLTVLVTEQAPPAGILRNIAEIYTSIGDDKKVYDANVCCWCEGDIIYVDAFADGYNNGTSWENAFVDLQDALTQYRAGCGTEIWVAQGFYDPGRLAEDTFDLPDGLSVYGGFKGDETTRSQRDPKQYKSVLTGGADESVLNEVVVTMGDEVLLDGFVITESADYGVYGNGVDFEVNTCTIENNEQTGMQGENGNMTVKWCRVASNKKHGVRHIGSGYELAVENSWLLRNMRYGIYSENSTPAIKNSVISESDLVQEGNQGIRIVNPTHTPKLYNNTIANNKAEGIYFEDNGNISGDPNYPDLPDIQNCIVYFNNAGGSQLAGFHADQSSYYSCIADCNSVNKNTSAVPMFAYATDPNGAPDPNGVPNPNNYHLHYDDTVCKDAGDPNGVYTGQVDMDNDSRDADGLIDIGADEIYSCSGGDANDISNALDWDADGLVNLKEFSSFQRAWLSRDPNGPTDPNFIDPNDFTNWNPVCNLKDTGDSEYIIDLADLQIFWSDTPWLWKACWKDDGLYETMNMSGGESMMAAPMTESLEPLDPVQAFTGTIKLSELNTMDKSIVEILAVIEQELQIVKKKDSDSLLEMKAFLADCLAEIRSLK